MDTRLAIGLSVDGGSDELRAALIRVCDVGLDCRVESLSSGVFPLQFGVRVGAAPHGRGESSNRTGFGLGVSSLPARLFDAVCSILEQASVCLDQVLVIGLTGVGDSPAESDAAAISTALAELSGITMVDGLSYRDCAAGGRGRPLGSIVDWILASDQRYARLVVHVEGETRLTILPAARGPARVQSFETGPGTDLLDALIASLSQGRKQIDPRGVLAVQGRQIKPLIRRWATHPFLRQAPPKWLSPGDFSGPFVEETVQMTVQRGWSVADVLCTASHFVAACPADVVRLLLAKGQPLEQAILVGKGAQNGFLLRLLEEQLAGLGVATTTLTKITPEAHQAVAAGVLACLSLDGVASSLPAITGASGPRLLGHLVPGSHSNWRQCIDWMHHTVKPSAVHAA